MAEALVHQVVRRYEPESLGAWVDLLKQRIEALF